MSWLGAPGPLGISDPQKTDPFYNLLIYASKKYDVDQEEILVGNSEVPPSDPACLVYIRILPMATYEFFKKNKDPNGRWVCWNYLSEIPEDLSKPIYNYRERTMQRRAPRDYRP